LHYRDLYSHSQVIQTGAITRAFLRVVNNPFRYAASAADIIECLHGESEAVHIRHQHKMERLKAEFELRCISLDIENRRYHLGI
jgi:hypothetical protein